MSMFGPATGPLHLNLDPASEVGVKLHVATKGIDTLWSREPCNRLIERRWRQIRIATGQFLAQHLLEDDFLPRALQILTVRVTVLEALETLDRCELELGLGAAVGHLGNLADERLGVAKSHLAG